MVIMSIEVPYLHFCYKYLGIKVLYYVVYNLNTFNPPHIVWEVRCVGDWRWVMSAMEKQGTCTTNSHTRARTIFQHERVSSSCAHLHHHEPLHLVWLSLQEKATISRYNVFNLILYTYLMLFTHTHTHTHRSYLHSALICIWGPPDPLLNLHKYGVNYF